MKDHLTSLEGLSEELAAEYEQRDGKEGYYLVIQPQPDGDVRAAQKALQTERGNFKKLERYGDITPEQAQEAIARVADLEARMESGQLTKAEELEAAMADARRKSEATEAEWKSKYGSLESKWDLRLRKEKARELLKAGGFESAADLMLDKLLPSLRLVRDENGELTERIEVVDENGVRRFGQRAGEDMTPAEAVAELHGPWGKWADGSGQSGGGIHPSGGSDRPALSKPVRQISSVETGDDLAAVAEGAAIRT
jgi:hypothetical protein